MWSDVILTRRKIVKMPQSVEKNATKTGKEFWLALASIGGIGPIQIRYLLREFETLEAAFSADLTEIARLPMFDSLLAAKLQKVRIGLSDLRRHIDWYESQGIQVITWQEATYPEQLKQISNAPVALACRGDFKSVQKPTVAIVGTRTPTSEGVAVTLELTNLLVQSGYTIASGLGKGVDLTAHTTALACDGLTCAVLPTDLLSIYPPENESLSLQIQTRGALFSEHIFPTPLSAANLLARHRVTTGLSIATIVVESSADDEVLRAASFAREQGRFVCSIDWGSRTDYLAEGCSQLIKLGAISVPFNGLAEFVESFTNSATTSEFQATYVQGEQMGLF